MKIGILMDPLDRIKPLKDSTVAISLEAGRRGWPVYTFTQEEVWLENGKVYAAAKRIEANDSLDAWYTLMEDTVIDLASMDVVLMRRDPPFDMNYIYATYLLELVEKAGVWVLNRPQSLRDANEKLYAQHFLEFAPPTMVSSQKQRLRAFLEAEKDIVLKPLDRMGGEGVVRMKLGDENFASVVALLTENGRTPLMAQKYLPEVAEGDKRIFMLYGEPVSHALIRVPSQGDFRANIAAGGVGHVRALTDPELAIARKIGQTLLAKGLLLVGLDMIGHYITEINVTSPTGGREIEWATGLPVYRSFVDGLEAQR